jgi:putative nucleotidyltransferase with HDIG domain
MVGLGGLGVPLKLSLSSLRPASMSNARRREDSHSLRAHLLVGVVSTLALVVAFGLDWQLPSAGQSRFWNAFAAFVLLSIVSDSLFFNIPTIAKAHASLAFIPLEATVVLFGHPWPMVIGGVTALVVDTVVRKKPIIRIVFNTAQYMLAVGLAGWVYRELGGSVGLDSFSFLFIPFVAMVITFFLVNQGSVALVVSFSSGVSVREAWGRIGGRALVNDLFSSTLAILLVFLYVKLQLPGIAILVFPLFLVRQLYQMNRQLQEELEEKLELMVKAMEARDPYTSGHSRRVAEYALSIGRELRLSADHLDGIKRAALLHDVGKIYEEFAPLLRKEGRLTPEERIVMRTHVVRSAELVATAAKFRGPVEAMIKHHHENFDGTGYPDGIAGEEIPIGARIIMIADTLDAMTTDRPYRRAMTFGRAVEELQAYAGRQFDPALVHLVATSPSIRRLLSTEIAPQFAPSQPKPAWGQRIAR